MSGVRTPSGRAKLRRPTVQGLSPAAIAVGPGSGLPPGRTPASRQAGAGVRYEGQRPRSLAVPLDGRKELVEIDRLRQVAVEALLD